MRSAETRGIPAASAPSTAALAPAASWSRPRKRRRSSVERLDADRQAVHPSIEKGSRSVLVERRRVALHRDLDRVARCSELTAHATEHPAELSRLPEARGSAAEEDAPDLPPGEGRRPNVDLSQYGVGVPGVVDDRRHVAHEVAVRALGQTPREMDVNAGKAHGDAALTRGDIVRTTSKLATSDHF